MRAKKKPGEISGLFEFETRKITRLKNKAAVNIYRDSMGRARTVNHLLTNKKLPISYEHPRNYMRYVEEYRSQAAECALLAQKVSDLHDKALWLFMAEAWLWFADDAAKLRGTGAPPEEIPGSAAAAR